MRAIVGFVAAFTMTVMWQTGLPMFAAQEASPQALTVADVRYLKAMDIRFDFLLLGIERQDDLFASPDVANERWRQDLVAAGAVVQAAHESAEKEEDVPDPFIELHTKYLEVFDSASDAAVLYRHGLNTLDSSRFHEGQDAIDRAVIAIDEAALIKQDVLTGTKPVSPDDLVDSD